MKGYINSTYRRGTTQYGVYVDSDSIKVEISCHNLSFKNYWGGEWVSSWTYNTSSQTLSGHIKVHNHYFEQGNIQFNLDKEYTAESLAATGKDIVDMISKRESEY